MFRVKVGDSEYKVTFHYTSQMTVTQCTIYRRVGERWDICAIDWARRNPIDNPCRATGRKVSLTRALKVFDKPTRTLFWQQYRTMGKPQGETNA